MPIDNTALIAGPYRTPRFRLGDVVTDEARDREVVIVGLSDARIPWPIGKPKGVRARSLVVFGALADAVRNESNLAVCHWWCVTPQTVSKWRKALGVDRVNDGTHRLFAAHFDSPLGKKARAKARAKARDLERRRKIAEARSGKSRPKWVIDKILATKRARAKPKPPKTPRINHRLWTVEADDLVRTKPPADAARLTGRTLAAVYLRRKTLGIAVPLRKEPR